MGQGKRTRSSRLRLSFLGLAVMGIMAAIWTCFFAARPPAPPLTQPASTAKSQPASPSTVASSDVTTPVSTAIPDPDQLRTLQRKAAENMAEYERVRKDLQRSRDEWKQRWEADTAKMKVEVAASVQADADAERRQHDAEVRVKDALESAKAAVEREKRERAGRAAASAPPPPNVTDF